MNEKLLKPYNPQETEDRIYAEWEKSGYFNPDNLPNKDGKPFTIIMPPPNANGHLHVGHALFITLEDILTRSRRMQGYRALWIPGADHAGFETQIVYEKKLEKEGRSRFQMDPQDLYKEIYAFTLENKKYMEDEVKAVGASCDWSREKFTLDPDVVAKVQDTFRTMFAGGLVYRGKRIINWCSKHQTSLSDVETESKEQADPFYYFQYGPFVIGTARPETKFGDKYVVVHPDDERYAEYQDGQKIELEWINGPITATVIKDEAIDREFGTGAMTITPWHSGIDFDISERHNLDKEQIIDFRGKLLPIAGEFAGMKIAEARPKIAEKLKEKGLLVKIEEGYKHSVPVCFKCSTPIEPQVKDQWFVKMQPLAKMALEAVDSGKIRFIPDNYEKIFRYWMNNTIDWNISRQIVWGIPIPAKLCTQCDFATTDMSLASCPSCSGKLAADPDTFDTWFSSGQWPLLALGYPESSDWKVHYPTDVMETGYDLIFKWIPRMVIFGLYLSKKEPFHTVYLHGLVNDAQGKKMSKSKGNVISPLDMISKYGADALRMALVIGNTPGTDMALAEQKIKGYKNFANKLWNIGRFVLTNAEGMTFNTVPTLSADQQKTMDEFDALITDVTADIDNYRLYLAAEKLYHYIWHAFADNIIEDAKIPLRDGSAEEKDATAWILMNIFSRSLKVLHPFMPFVTEELWSLLPAAPALSKKTDGLLIVERW